MNQDPLLIDEPDDCQKVQDLFAQPAITRTCKVIRSETISLFYKTNEFRFVDDGECTLRGLSKWVRAIWNSQWLSVGNCTIESKHEDIIDHMCAEFDGFAEVHFDGEAPEGEVKVLKFTASEVNGDARVQANLESEDESRR